MHSAVGTRIANESNSLSHRHISLDTKSLHTSAVNQLESDDNPQKGAFAEEVEMTTFK